MPILDFPPTDEADENGLLAIGGDMDPTSLRLAYERGIFPWPINKEYPLAWFSPDPRGILHLDQFTISRSLKKFLNKGQFRVSFNTNFESVILNCARITNRKEKGTWITDPLANSYIDFFREGNAYSVEVWDGNDSLCGGLYGVNIGSYFSGESMFYKLPNASKIAIVSLMSALKKRGVRWLDTQMVTPVVASLGGIEVSRKVFEEMLKTSLMREVLSLSVDIPDNEYKTPRE